MKPGQTSSRAKSLQLGSTSVTPTVSQQIGLQEFWKWMAGFALVILMIEWQVFHRKPLRIRMKAEG
ncbi:MAG: hypothetical protein IPL71_10705 [Anaerolineales bacterium]|uniref:hypothetical protein n=1 Tax=Candidatus Villigracilis proximus TaxID=3140683 RepID=UPI003136F2EA|nr:hypothetical protein [Anaerolineales bacterium]